MISIGIKTKDRYSYHFIFFELRTMREYYRLCLFAFCTIKYGFRPLFNFSVTEVGKNKWYVSICVLFFIRLCWVWNKDKKKATDIIFIKDFRKGETK